MCSVAAGMKEAPPQDDVIMQGLVEALGGIIVPDAPESRPDPISALMSAKEIGIPWTALYTRLADVIESVAMGTVHTTASQVSMLKEVIKEAKAEMAKEADNVQHVVLLPSQGSGAEVKLDPQWRARIAALEAAPIAEP